MSRILTITISTLMLAGCAASYDGTAMPEATAALQHETVGCKTKWTAKEVTTYSEWQACQLSAEREFVKAIALTKMDAFDAYASNMQALAADRDAHRVTDNQLASRAHDIRGKFLADCGCKLSGARVRGYSDNFAGRDNFGGPQMAPTNGAFELSPRGRELSGT